MRQIATYLALADRSEQTLADSFRTVGLGHARQADVFHTCHLLAAWSDEHRQRLASAAQRYGESDDVDEPDRLHTAALPATRGGQVGLLRDLQDLHVLGTLVQTTWTVVAQAAQGLRDQELLEVARSCNTETSRQLTWLNTRMKEAAPQALIAGDST
jgi:hypothetical protein